AAGTAAPAPSPAAGSAPVVELTQGGSELPAARRRAVEQAIVAVADAAGVVVCRDGTSLSQPESTALDRVCATPGLPRLWWDAEIGTEKSGEVEVLDVLLEVAIGGPPAESPRSIVAPHALLPAKAQAEERETAVLDGVHRSLLAADDLRIWLAGLKQRPELLRARPAASPAAHRRPASEGQLRVWDSELRQIADLLIDGHYLEGRDRAVRLLKEDPPPEVAGRARELLAKADAKLRRVGGAAPRVGETGQIVIRPSQSSPSAQSSSGTPRRQPWERGFDVRVAKDDRGLANGPEGRLLVSEDGASFTPKGGSRPDWSISWRDLAAAHRAEGLWDVPYPLALVEKSGRVHHLVRVDAAGKPLPGGAVLSALAAGRLASHKGYN
ncbi:MAG TPA: hypothetical protein VGR07_22540, partial [Thermoanaerobaculia bacterium]|nr:hypothetical protein [Thermoanaerobaculia bacterium]